MPEAVPIFTKRDPITGAVLFDFAGHIHAQGLDLDGGPAAAAPTENKVRWLSTVDGSTVAQLSGNRNLDGTTSVSLDAGGTNYDLRDDSANTLNQLLFVQTRSGQSATILRGDGASSFLKLDTLRSLKISQQFQINVGGIAAGAGQAFVVNVGNILNGEWHIVGYFNQANGGGWLDWCTWAVAAFTTSQVTINVANQGAGVTAGAFYFYVVHI